MGSKTAAALTVIFQILTKVLKVIELPHPMSSVAPTLAGWIHIAATQLILLDTSIYPELYTNIPKPCQLFAELIIFLVVTEISTVKIWGRLENAFHHLIKCMLLENNSTMYYDMGGDSLAKFLLACASAYIFYNVTIATNYGKIVRKSVQAAGNKLFEKLTNTSAREPMTEIGDDNDRRQSKQPANKNVGPRPVRSKRGEIRRLYIEA